MEEKQIVFSQEDLNIIKVLEKMNKSCKIFNNKIYFNTPNSSIYVTLVSEKSNYIDEILSIKDISKIRNVITNGSEILPITFKGNYLQVDDPNFTVYYNLEFLPSEIDDKILKDTFTARILKDSKPDFKIKVPYEMFKLLSNSYIDNKFLKFETKKGKFIIKALNDENELNASEKFEQYIKLDSDNTLVQEFGVVESSLLSMLYPFPEYELSFYTNLKNDVSLLTIDFANDFYKIRYFCSLGNNNE